MKIEFVTQWFEPHEKPVHKGTYQTQTWSDSDIGSTSFWVQGADWRWDGKQWCLFSDLPLYDQHRRWRGIAK